MTCIRWNQSYELGIPRIDTQHKHLIEIMNQFCENLDKNPDIRKTPGKSALHAATAQILDDMKDYAASHLELEEKLFQEFHYDKAEAHLAQHEIFRQKIRQLESDFEKDNNGVASETMAFLSNWFVEHILGMDRLYVQCFHEHGL